MDIKAIEKIVNDIERCIKNTRKARLTKGRVVVKQGYANACDAVEHFRDKYIELNNEWKLEAVNDSVKGALINIVKRG
jgi:hypothetical protein